MNQNISVFPHINAAETLGNDLKITNARCNTHRTKNTQAEDKIWFSNYFYTIKYFYYFHFTKKAIRF